MGRPNCSRVRAYSAVRRSAPSQTPSCSAPRSRPQVVRQPGVRLGSAEPSGRSGTVHAVELEPGGPVAVGERCAWTRDARRRPAGRGSTRDASSVLAGTRKRSAARAGAHSGLRARSASSPRRTGRAVVGGRRGLAAWSSATAAVSTGSPGGGVGQPRAGQLVAGRARRAPARPRRGWPAAAAPRPCPASRGRWSAPAARARRRRTPRGAARPSSPARRARPRARGRSGRRPPRRRPAGRWCSGRRGSGAASALDVVLAGGGGEVHDVSGVSMRSARVGAGAGRGRPCR